MCLEIGTRWSRKEVWLEPNVPQSLAGDHQMGLGHTEDVMNSPCRQHLSHRFVNHFGGVVCFNCHWPQKPNQEHLLQKRICKTAFSAQDHTCVLPMAALHPCSYVMVWELRPQVWLAFCTSARTLPKLWLLLSAFCPCGTTFPDQGSPALSSAS